MLKPALTAAALAGFLGIALAPVAAAATPLSTRDSFRIGSGGSLFCTAQSTATDAALRGMFDAAYAIACRDSVLPIGRMYKLRDSAGGAARLAAARASDVDCAAQRAGEIALLGAVEMIDCKSKTLDVNYRVYQLRRGNAFYSAEGYAGYDDAIRLGLQSIVLDRPVKGEIAIATVGLGDPAALARVQAGAIDSKRAMAEAYRRNNSGNYAEAAEFFAAAGRDRDGGVSRAEALANQALQRSNLGRFAEADRLFFEAGAAVGNDPLTARRLRNFRAMHDLNHQPLIKIAALSGRALSCPNVRTPI